MKSKQGLIEKWESAIKAAEFYGKGKEDRLIEYMRDFVSDLSQLEEPEVLSQEWIDGHKYPDTEYPDEHYVWEISLQNLLVPKQELPVIPQFVADFIEKWKNEGLTMSEWFAFDYDDEDENKVAKWLYNNDDETNKYREFMLIDAIRYGYEVEKEKRFYAKIKGWQLLSRQHLTYFNYDTQEEKFLLSIKKDSDIIKTKFTKEEWAVLGINDTNADFEEVTE